MKIFNIFLNLCFAVWRAVIACVGPKSHQLLFITVFLLSTSHLMALNITSYYSPREHERPVRPHTYYIILHTTEGPKKGSLNKVYMNGETHYFIDENGHAYRIIHRNKIAFHAGRSIWEGHSDIDNYSIGIEMVGYHNRDITSAQYVTLKVILDELKKIYKIPDNRVLTHSMVAYGAPNRWHKRSHRGRKRCGMLFATQSVRLKLGLKSKPLYDPDVKAGRLVNADSYLAQVLYGNTKEQEYASRKFTSSESNVISSNRSAWDIARDKYKSADTFYTFPDGKKYSGNQIKNWKKIPTGTLVQYSLSDSDSNLEGVKVLGVDGDTALEIAGDEYNKKTTIYFLPDGKVLAGSNMKESEFNSLPVNTKILVGYIDGGVITSKHSAFDVCAEKWNFPSTFYRFPDGNILQGDKVNEKTIPLKTMVFFRS